MAKWKCSLAYSEIVSFIEQLSQSVEGKTVSSQYEVSTNAQNICQLLEETERWIDQFPPDTSSTSRFGNKSFRKWHDKLTKQAPELLRRLLPPRLCDATPELAPYLSEGFGNATRIDYGSGHELSFLVWLLCLCKVGYLEPSDSTAIVLVVFKKYLDVCRQLQRMYKLEPAGSHGVWGLDDYQFLPFYFGSAQFIGSEIAPAESISPRLICEQGDEYLYLQGIRFIMEMKSGPFFEHSRQLYDISGVPKWEKVNQGLGKMYKAEVLGKFPVVQHLLFGSLASISSSAAYRS
ncbi:Serine/threonine-protein phosphatase 2A activator [Coemansia guatemalensis]|uniref:Serine/threonine-protein phosphatase 2A activator n=1 Tax=Coemansia guatemalensis TaxID=2761395 RepID=A0A9W8HTF4_9FUNG|nr:Serine/threonine-protein phosphatase 2A activator [Coemansia guatemalensis]